MPTKISRDSPLGEITLRRYERPYKMTRRETIRKLCLSLGLLQPGDSRDIMVEVLQTFLDAAKKKQLLNSEEVQKKVITLRKKNKQEVYGVAASNVRRQMKRLRDLRIIEKIKNEYRITEFEPISKIFDDHIEKFYLLQIKDRVKEYCKAVK